MQYLTIKKHFENKIIAFPESFHNKIDAVIINEKFYKLKPDIIYNQYVFEKKNIPNVKEISFSIGGKQYPQQYIEDKSYIIKKEGRIGFGMITSKNGVIGGRFFDEMCPDIDSIIKNKYLFKLRNYSWLFFKLKYERKKLKKETNLKLLLKNFPNLFYSNKFNMINKSFVEYVDIAKLYSSIEQGKTTSDNIKKIVEKYTNSKFDEDFNELKTTISEFLSDKTENVKNFINSISLNVERASK